MASMIQLNARASYMEKGQYIARITGRNPEWTFEREFVGERGGKRKEASTADIDEPGLFECCDIDKKSNKVKHYALVLQIEGGGDNDLDEYSCEKEHAMKIAKMMDAGKTLKEIVIGESDGWSFRK
jgi:hypothetical protein